MEEIDLSNPELSEIIKIPGNEICADCEEKNPRWSSINNGVLICSKCTRKHRKYGEKISKIKSLEVDEWNNDEIKILKIGGNYRFNNLINEYNIPLTKENQEYKYYTKIAEYYRNSLKEEIKGNLSLVNRPSLKDGIKKIETEENENIKKDDNNTFENINNINNNQNFSNYNINNQKQNNNQFVNPFINTFGQNHQIILNNNNNNLSQNNNLSNFHQQTNNINYNNNYNGQQNNYVNNSNNQGNSFSQETLSHNWNNFVYSMGSFFNNVGKKISNTMKEYEIDKRLNLTANYLANKTEEVTNSEIFKSFAQTAEEGYNSIKRKANEIMDNNNLYYNINDNIVEEERKSEIKIDNLDNNNNQNIINENIQNPIKFNIEENKSNDNENKKTNDYNINNSLNDNTKNDNNKNHNINNKKQAIFVVGK